MFVSNMKILTLNPSNTSPTTQSGGATQTITKVFNNSGNVESEGDRVVSITSGTNHNSNKREQKHNSKIKFVNVNSNKIQLHTTQQQHQHQSQKYNHKNNNNNNNNNNGGNKLKNQHYNNSNNNNSTSSLNRKKYYQQQQYHQQQQQQKHYQKQHHQKHQYNITVMEKNINSTQTTITNNNNNNNNNSILVKNRNYKNVTLHTQQHNQQPQQNITNNVNNLQSTKILETCTCLLQQNNCDKLSLSSSSSGSAVSTSSPSLTTATGDCHRQNQQSHTICYDSNLKNSLNSNSKTSILNASQTTSSTASPACITCWSNITKVPQQQSQSATSLNLKSSNISNEFDASHDVAVAATSKSDSNLNLTKTTLSSFSSIISSTSASSTSSGGQLHVISNTSTFSLVSKKKSIWKNSNSSGDGATAIIVGGDNSSSSSGYSSGSTTNSPKLSEEKEHHASDKNLIANTSKNLDKNNNNKNGIEQKYSTTLVSNVATTKQTQISKNHLPASEKLEMTTSLEASSNSTSIKTPVSSNNSNTASYSCATTPSKQQQGTLDKPNESKQMLKSSTNNSSSKIDINKTTTKTSSPTATSSQNSYTLDFLHSVGVKMTGVALRSPGKQGPTNGYGNQTAAHSPVHSSYSYTGMTTNQRQPRYMYGGSNTNNANSGNQQQHYHHHQPSQLTIASFLNKDLLGADSVLLNANGNESSGGTPSSASNPRNANNYNDKQQQHHYTHQQLPTQSRYHHNYYAATYQQQSAVIQNTSYGGGGGYGESTRYMTNSSGGGQRNPSYGYTNYHNAAGEGGVGKNSTMSQQHPRQLKSNVGNYRNSVNNSQVSKKSSYASSITSTGSSSSSNSISSNSSNISNRQLHTATPHESNNNVSNLNLVVESLPSKVLGGGSQRGNHRGHHNHHANHYSNHHQHIMLNSPNVLHHQNYYNLTYVTTDSSACGATSRGCSPASQSVPPTPISATNCHSPKSLENASGHVAMLMNFNAGHLPYPRYANAQQLSAAQQQQHFHQFQQRQQQQNCLNKKMLVPLSLNMPSPLPSPTSLPNAANISINSHQAPPPPHNIISCSQLDEATTAAAAAAATSSSSSGVIAGSDCDSDASSNDSTSKAKYRALKSIKSSSVSSSSTSSSSASSISVAAQVQQQTPTQPTAAITCVPATTLTSPVDYNYSAATTQTFSNVQVTQQPQLPQFNGNNNGAVISLLNMPIKPHNIYSDEDYQQQQQQLQQQQLYFNATANQRASEQLNVGTTLTAVTNCSNNSSAYWSPSYHNSQFLYHQTTSAQMALIPATITSSSSSCGSSSASISPRLPSDELQQQQTHQRLHNNYGISDTNLSPSPSASLNEQFSSIAIGNSSNADSGMFLGSSCSSNSSSVSSGSNNGSGFSSNSTNGGLTYKTGSSQLLGKQQRLIAQQPYQSSSSSASSLSSSSASTLTSAVRARGGGGEIGINSFNGRNNQLPPLSQASIISSVANSICGIQHLPPTPTHHIYSHHQQQHQSLPPPLSPHNLLYNSPQTHHMRALSSSSPHDFFTHTPPDRFLARSHLIEAKEAPSTLLNNSKWDHLSQDIWKKFIHCQQTEETFKQKMMLWRHLYLFIKNAYPRYGLYLVGSTISGFGSDSSDVDMCLVSRGSPCIDPRLEALYNLTVLRDCLSKTGEFENFNLIEAKVPILRFCDRMHQLEVDLNFNNCVGIKNTHLLYCYSQLDWRLRPLVLVTKLWAQYHNINNAKNMTISSYSLVLMVIHFLQYAVNPPVLPCLHELFPDKFPLLRSNDFGYVDMNETIGPYDSKNTQSIGELFLLFLEYYSCFDYTQYAISIRTGGLLPVNICRVTKSIKNDVHQWKELCIEEPFDLTNTARSVYDYETFERVKAVFVASWRILQETLDLNSVFSTIMIPSPCSVENFTMVQNLNPITTSSAATFNEIESNINATDSDINFEQSAKDSGVSTTPAENYEGHSKSSVEHDDVEGDNTDEGDDNFSATNSSIVNKSTTRILPKRKDFNRTLTPRKNKVSFSPKEFPIPSSSSSSLNCIKTATKNINRNNKNNKTATPIIS